MQLRLTAADGFSFDAYLAEPEGAPRGAIVVIQEIFGVNGHIREVADGYAAAGYVAVAPALYDRAQPGIELGYTPDDIQEGIQVRGKVALDDTLADIAAAADEARSRAGQGAKVGAVGYCWGGFLASAIAQRLAGRVDASVAYYGGGIAQGLLGGDAPALPLMLHFGELDHAIPLDDVEKIRTAWPQSPAYVYVGAEHGFNCDQRASYHAHSARVALSRTLRFFTDHVG
jgi:carboxymethylenebutenolidase